MEVLGYSISLVRNILRIHPSMKAPEKYLAIPIADVSEAQILNVSKGGFTSVPKNEFVEIPDAFGCRRLCVWTLLPKLTMGPLMSRCASLF